MPPGDGEGRDHGADDQWVAATGIGRATDLVEEVEDFQHFDSPGATEVWVVEPGRYAVFHEERVRGADDPSAPSP